MKRIILKMLAIIKHRLIRILNFYGLKEMDKMKDNFISLASHELRSPLTAIKGYMELLKDHNVGKLDEESLKYLKNMNISIERLNALINDILEISRIEGNRIPFEFSTFNPEEVTKKLISEVKIQAKKKGLEIEYSFNSNVEIKTDKKRFEQIMANLISNAVKYTEKGKVEIKSEIKSGELHISVKDTGIGISEDDMENLFQKFYRIKSDKTKSVSGTGLGLWIVKGLAKKMGGDVIVESVEGIGSKFTLILPLE